MGCYGTAAVTQELTNLGLQKDYLFYLIVKFPSLEIAISSHNTFESFYLLIVAAAAMLCNGALIFPLFLTKERKIGRIFKTQEVISSVTNQLKLLGLVYLTEVAMSYLKGRA